MSRLIILSGASGAGKSYLLKQLSIYGKIVPLKKLTTRPARHNEFGVEEVPIDLVVDSKPEDVQKCEFTYLYYNHYYGLSKSSIDQQLCNGYYPAVIVADCLTIRNIRECYKNALVIYVQNVLSGNDLRHELMKHGDPLDVENRLQRQVHSLRDYTNNVEKGLFDYVVINDFSENLMMQIKYILDKEITHGINDNSIFVIMPFATKYSEVYRAYQHAADSIRSVKLKRVDDKRGGYVITHEIEACIRTAGLIICDVTDIRPNVFYELGYAMALNKSIIVTAKAGTKLPFDVVNYRTVFYDTPMDLQDKIIDELKSHYRR